MNLEIKHLDNYLSHKLMCVRNESNPVELVGLRFGNESVNNELWIWKEGKQYLTGYLYECKPILRPLSDLTKEIEHNGQKFVPMEYLFEFENPYNKIPKRMKYHYEEVPNRISISHNASSRDTEVLFSEMGANPYWMIQKLFEWHFDVFGLIGKGLALPLI